MLVNICTLFTSMYIHIFFARSSYRYERTLTSMNARTHTLPLWAYPKNWVGQANLEIDKFTTERIALLDPGINPEKYEHPCQVGDLNPSGQVPPQETQPAELRSDLDQPCGSLFHCWFSSCLIWHLNSLSNRWIVTNTCCWHSITPPSIFCPIGKALGDIIIEDRLLERTSHLH